MRPGSPRVTRVRARAATSLLICTAALALAGCATYDAEHELVVTGSTTILPIAEVAAEKYEDVDPTVNILVSGVGSSAGIETVASGSAQIGTSSRELKPTEAELGLVDTPLAFDAIAVIVNPSNPVKALTRSQIRDVFAGRVTNWKNFGGPDLPIGLVNRDEASGTREAFAKIVMEGETFDRGAVVLPGTGQVRAVVADAPGAIGYISLGFVTEDVRALAVDGVVPTEDAVVLEAYPVQRVLHAFTLGEPTGLAGAYLDFLLSPAIQDTIVREAGFIPITAKRPARD